MSSNQLSLTGQMTPTVGRSPKTYETNRVCADDACRTRPNKYNRPDRCSVHKQVRYPRVRGRKG